MARYRTTISTASGPEAVFAYLADFSNAAAWDPGVAAASRRDDGPVELGTLFDLDLLVAGRTQRWTYAVERFEAPTRVTFATRTARAVGIDDVTVRPSADGGAVVEWDASFRFTGVLGRLVDPAFQLVFHRIAAKAVAGLQPALDQLGSDEVV